MGFEMIHRENLKQKTEEIKFCGLEAAKEAQRYHESFPVYEKTPLYKLNTLAEQTGVKGIYIKDESYRFGLNAFKVLGGSYAIGSYIAKQLDIPMKDLTYDKIISSETREQLGKVTFICATDGNHGRGVAWTANQLKQDCIIYMPKGSAIERLDNIRAEGAKAEITDFNYDDAVRLANKEAGENGWVLIQDTSFPGYEEIPKAIIKGYTTMAYEVYQQLDNVKPTHIFVQSGVGSFATAITGFFTDVYKEERPIITIIEPEPANCIFKTMKAADGEIHIITGEINTIMAGLACGEPVTVGMPILRDFADNFVSCPDYVAAQGMRVLSSPLPGDERVIAGESGAAGLGFAYEVMTNPELTNLKEQLGINENSILLFFNTEGDTDKENYRKIVWDGAYQRP